MMNPNRVVDIYSFFAPTSYEIPGTNVTVKAGRNTIVREDKIYILKDIDTVYDNFSIDFGHFLFKFLRGDRPELEVSDK